MIKFKCPVCGTILMTTAATVDPDKVIRCPNCKEKRPFKEYKSVVSKTAQEDDKTEYESDAKTEVNRPKDASPGHFVDRKTGAEYALSEGVFTMGRKPKKEPPFPDIQIVTDDLYMSRLHVKVDVRLAKDGHYHVRLSNAKNQNETYVNGEMLKDGDEVGLKHGDIVKLADTELEYVGTPVDDKTEVHLKK